VAGPRDIASRDGRQIGEIVQIKVAAQNLSNTALRNLNGQAIATIVCTTLAKAEQDSPTVVADSFLLAGKPFDTLKAVRKVLE